MFKMCATITAILIIATSAVKANSNFRTVDGVEVKQDKNGRVAITSAKELTQVKCFNEEGKKFVLEVSNHKKNIKLGNKLEKGTWYFQVKTEAGETVVRKLEIA